MNEICEHPQEHQFKAASGVKIVGFREVSGQNRPHVFTAPNQ
jgi:hypothetical protein